MDFQYYFDDQWWLWVWHNFSILMIMIPSILGSIVKLIAKIHPGVPSDTIMELIQVIFTKPGSVPEKE